MHWWRCRLTGRALRIISVYCGLLMAVLFCLLALCVPVSICAAPPTPRKSPRLGCFYFPGWYTADRWAPIQEYGGREPILGYYRDSLPKVQDWHIRQAVQHGISFWVFDWYFDAHTGAVSESNAALDTGFLGASLRSKMDFAVMWCNEEAGAPSYTEAEMLRMVRIVDERYLSQANYLRAPDGRNVFAITRPDRLIEKFGIEGTRALLQKMSAAAQDRGGLYYVAITDPGVKDLSELKRAGIDACTLYCYATQGMPANALSGPYDTILPAARQTWESGAKQKQLPLIPTVSPDWDSRAWYGDKALWRSDPTPAKFESLCRIVKPYIDPNLNMAMVGTWNEFGEGTYIEPTRDRGYAYLDALKRAFFPGSSPHNHPGPSAGELVQLDYRDIPSHLERQVAAQNGNLIINPGFERDWGWVTFDGSRAEFTQTIAHSGRRSLVLAKDRGGVKSQRLEPGIPWPNRWNNLISIKPGVSHRVSAWVFGKASLKCALFDRNGAWLNRYREIAAGGTAGEWRQLSGVITADDPDAVSFDVEIVPSDAMVYVDDVEVRLN